jgi:hypothetical protein
MYLTNQQLVTDYPQVINAFSRWWAIINPILGQIATITPTPLWDSYRVSSITSPYYQSYSPIF